MHTTVELWVCVLSMVVGLSHILRFQDWAEAYRLLAACGRPGAFVNGGIHLAPGAAIVACHGAWDGPGAVVTALGWLLVAKGAVCLLAPGLALTSMRSGARRPRGFIVAGVLQLALGAWAGWCACA